MGHALPRFQLQDFLAWENAQPDKHEFYNGEAWAMVGAKRIHGIVALNAAASLKEQLKGSPCRAFMSDMKLQVDDNVFYPDVFVTCHAADLRATQVFRSPTVLIEVLSPSTEAFDRGLKFAAYRRIPTLVEYLLVDPATREVSLFRRGAEGLFTLHDLSAAAAVELASIGCTITLGELFEGAEEDGSAQDEARAQEAVRPGDDTRGS